MIAAFFCGICPPSSPGGLATYGCVVKIEGQIVWTDAQCIGSGYKFDVNSARYAGAIACLRKLKELRATHPAAAITLVTDSKTTVEQVRGEWSAVRTPLLDEAQSRVKEMGSAIELRYCKRRDNLESHALARQFLERRGIRYPEDTIR